MKMKKAFTLIELAIALLVIGLILAMAMQGRTIVDAARAKSDVAKMDKLTAAILSYYSKFGKIPGETDTAGVYSNAQFVDDLEAEGLMVLSDFQLDTDDEGFINIAGCTAEAGLDTNLSFNAFATKPHLCMVITAVSPDKVGPVSAYPAHREGGSLPCYIEDWIDDKDYWTGAGRGPIERGDAFKQFSNNCAFGTGYSEGLPYGYIVY